MSTPIENQPTISEHDHALEAAGVCKALVEELAAIAATIDPERYLTEEQALEFLESIPEGRITRLADTAAKYSAEIEASGEGVAVPNVLCSPNDTSTGTIEIRGGREVDILEAAKGTFVACIINAYPVELNNGETAYEPRVEVTIQLPEQIPISYAPFIQGAFMRYAVIDLAKNPTITFPLLEKRDHIYELLQQVPAEIDQGTFELMDLGLCTVRDEVRTTPGQSSCLQDVLALREAAEIASTLCKGMDPELVAQFMEIRLDLAGLMVQAHSNTSIPVKRVAEDHRENPASADAISWLQIPASAEEPRTCVGLARGIIICESDAATTTPHPLAPPHTPLLVLENEHPDGTIDTSYVPLAHVTALVCTT